MESDIDAQAMAKGKMEAEYADDIFKYMQSQERLLKPNSEYMSLQTEITARIRAKIVEFYRDILKHRGYTMQTFYLACSILDRFFGERNIPKDNAQLCAAACFKLAAKIENQDFGNLNWNFDMTKIRAMQIVILKALDWKLGAPTSYYFIERFITAAQVENVRKLRRLTLYINQLSLLDYNMLQFLPSEIAAASVYQSLFVMSEEKVDWNSILEKVTGYTLPQLTDCIQALEKCIREFGRVDQSLPLLYKIYNSKKREHIASLVDEKFKMK